VLAVHRLCKSFGARHALMDVSLTLNSGEFVAVLGPSGSGKTTLFRCITRLMEPDSGDIFVDDVALGGLSGAALAAQRRKIGVVFQQFNLIRRLSAVDNVLAASASRITSINEPIPFPAASSSASPSPVLSPKTATYSLPTSRWQASILRQRPRC
jgi:phosphonate transport system ATP-binding protein